MCKVAVIGAGPAGCFVACNTDKNIEVTLFDKYSPLKTILPTGGGKCNLAHAEFDFRELAKSYPHGEKFLYSLFSKFGTAETLEFFEKIGVKTYTREDDRIFPVSNSSKEVRDKILAKLHHCKFQKEEVLDVKKIDCGFKLKTNKAEYLFDYVIIATGGKSSYKIAESLGHTIIPPRPALVGLKTKPDYKELQGVTVKNCKITCNKKIYEGNILFTEDGITGPPVFELSSINARENFPYKIHIDFINKDLDFQEELNKSPHKNLGTLLAEYLPKSFVSELLKQTDLTQKCCTVKADIRESVLSVLRNCEINIVGTRKDGETVTCGGVSLAEINSKTMESKKVKGVYFCGEIIDADGFCGGYNLQLCWSSGYVAACAINEACSDLN